MRSGYNLRSVLVVACGILAIEHSTKVFASKPPATPYSSVVRRNFSSWDLDHDGKLTVDEVDHCVVSHRVKGRAAAALATFKYIERSNSGDDKATPPFTLEWIERYEEARAAGKEIEYNLDRWFDEYWEKVQHTKRELFAEGPPRFTAVRQGDLGDCYFMCAVGNFVNRDPAEVQRMIVAKPNGSFEVHFAGVPRQISVAAPTDTEIALNSTARENGLWLTVLEKAFGKIETKRRPKASRKKESTDTIAHGGGSTGSIALLTGHDIDDVEHNDPRLHRLLSAAQREHCLMTTSVRKDVTVPPGTRTGHVYSVIAYDAAKRRVSIFDPYGDDYAPDGTPGAANGFTRKKGVIVISLEEFTQIFNGLYIENKSKAAKFQGAAAGG